MGVGFASLLARGTNQLRDAHFAIAEQAQSLGADPPGTQHLLLVLAGQEEGMARRVLTELGVTSAKARRAVLGLATAETRQADAENYGVRFSRELDAVFLAADRYSHARQDHYVGTPHLLWAIGDSDESLGRAALLDLGIDSGRLDAEVNHTLIAHPEAQRDWEVVRENAEQHPLLTREEEHELARTTRAGRTAMETVKDEHGSPGLRLDAWRSLEPELWEVFQEGSAARDRLFKSNFRLLVEVGELYERQGHDPFWVWERASKALAEAIERWDVRDDAERFRDYVWPLLIERVDEDLARLEGL